ncbi:MAG: PEP-CTERM sorting domain-containing protein [Verrucomicrobiae bacterium]|nr:PEP-CTERM sorting domain-containing protein [Verrucomicrobiae bacterium]
MNTNRLKTTVLAAVLASSTFPCLGQGVIYSSREAFDAAITTLSGNRLDVNFDGPLPPGGTDFGGMVGYMSPLIVSGVAFHGSVFLYDTGSGWILNNYDSLSPLVVDMNAPSLAFGADFASFLSPTHTSFTATVSLDNGAVFTFEAPADPDFVFFGFVTAQPFSRLTFSDGGLLFGYLHEELLDNITVVTIPEPVTLGLFSLGALVLGWRLRRKFQP